MDRSVAKEHDNGRQPILRTERTPGARDTSRECVKDAPQPPVWAAKSQKARDRGLEVEM